MSAPQVKLQPVRNPVLPAKQTPEYKYWRGYRNPIIVKENLPVNHIHFSPTSPHDFVVTSSTRLQIFSSKTRQVTKTFSRFDGATVYSGEFRSDGSLVVAGDSKGIIRVFDPNSRSAALITLHPSNHPTQLTKFHPTSITSLLSCSDDKLARLWDLTSSKPVATFEGHDDYVRAGCFVPSSDLVVTGSFDKKVRLFDSRVGGKAVNEFDQGSQVEDVLALNETTLVTAGDVVKVWDLTSGKQIKELGNFQQPVSCLADAGERGLMAGSLDGHVKVFDSNSTNWDVKFGWKFGSKVLSTGISPHHKHVVTGLISGVFSIRTKKTEPRVAQGVKTEKSGNFQRMIRGAEYHGELEHRIINDNNKPTKKLKAYERHLNAFRWGDALDAAFVGGMAPELTVTVLEELKKRGKVQIALRNRDEDSLEPILKWAIKAVQDTRSLTTAADYVGCIVDMYADLIDKSPILEDLVNTLIKRVRVEIDRAKEANRIEGMLEMLLSR